MIKKTKKISPEWECYVNTLNAPYADEQQEEFISTPRILEYIKDKKNYNYLLEYWDVTSDQLDILSSGDILFDNLVHPNVNKKYYSNRTIYMFCLLHTIHHQKDLHPILKIHPSENAGYNGFNLLAHTIYNQIISSKNDDICHLLDYRDNQTIRSVLNRLNINIIDKEIALSLNKRLIILDNLIELLLFDNLINHKVTIKVIENSISNILQIDSSIVEGYLQLNPLGNPNELTKKEISDFYKSMINHLINHTMNNEDIISNHIDLGLSC